MKARFVRFFLGHVLALPMKRSPVGGAQDAKSVGPCTPPSLGRCRGGRITDSPPFIGATGYNGCGSTFAGARVPLSSTICLVVAMGLHVACRSILRRVRWRILSEREDLRSLRRRHQERHVCQLSCRLWRLVRCCATTEVLPAKGWALPPDSLARSCSASLLFTPRSCLPSSISWQREPALCRLHAHMHATTRTH